METLSSIEAFVRSAEAGSFSQAARNLGLTAAAVSKNVAKLEQKLGVRLFQRSTRSLVITEAGARFLADVAGGLNTIQAAIGNVASAAGKPAGTLKISLALSFGREHVLPVLNEYMQQYPDVTPDLHFDNRSVDLVGEGFDVAIGGGIELVPGVVARELCRAHAIVVASPAYLAGRELPVRPADMSAFEAIQRRSQQTGRIRAWHLRNASGEEAPVEMKTCAVMTDPEAMCHGAMLGMGVAVVPRLHALPFLENGSLVRLLPQWYAELGALSIYFASSRLMPSRTRLFVDHCVARFSERGLARTFSAL